jgi:undecaprenyl phosphate-alpha-L-ara4N flippase subunit ArnE
MLMFALLLGSVLCDVAGQVCFKLGLSGDNRTTGGGVGGFLGGLARSPLIGVGIAVYAFEFVLWFAALSLAPLNLAFAFAALSYCGVVLASRTILKEQVSANQWRATCTIAVGVALVCWPHAH